MRTGYRKESVNTEGGQLRARQHGVPPTKVVALNPRGHVVALHCDRHDVSFRERKRDEGFVFADEKTVDEFKQLEAERLAQSEDARNHRALMSPQGRKMVTDMAAASLAMTRQMEAIKQAEHAREIAPVPPLAGAIPTTSEKRKQP